MKKSSPVALSTAWNYNSLVSVKAALSEIKQIGFDAIEVSYNFTPERLDELITSIKDMGIDVLSVHNFCPAPPECMPGRHISDAFRISSPDEKERRKAVDYTKKTIDTLKRLSCGVVVLHAGAVEINKGLLENFLGMHYKGMAGSDAYNRIRQKVLDARNEAKGPYINSVVKSLEEIIPYAHSAEIKVAIETRYYPHEIPNIDEIGYLLNLFSDRNLVYWHDVGHGQANEKFGITAHKDFLTRFERHLFGMHIHGVRGIDDHLAPFKGDLDFNKIAPYLHDGVIRVIESHSNATPEELIRARDLLKKNSKEKNSKAA